jgi:hypothetical protein
VKVIHSPHVPAPRCQCGPQPGPPYEAVFSAATKAARLCPRCYGTDKPVETKKRSGRERGSCAPFQMPPSFSIQCSLPFPHLSPRELQRFCSEGHIFSAAFAASTSFVPSWDIPAGADAWRAAVRNVKLFSAFMFQSTVRRFEANNIAYLGCPWSHFLWRCRRGLCLRIDRFQVGHIILNE